MESESKHKKIFVNKTFKTFNYFFLVSSKGDLKDNNVWGSFVDEDENS
jgi:hypothetical protein